MSSVPGPGRRLILASASRPRLRLLLAAGFAPEAWPSDVAEDEVDGLAPDKAAVALAERKALAVASRLTGRAGQAGHAGTSDTVGQGPVGDQRSALVVGCDTILLMDGEPCGKPESLDQAREWCRRQRETDVEVVTGHCVVDSSTGRQAVGASWSTVEVGAMSDEEIEAYLATGEALNAAGGLTIDGYGAPFIAGIRGDHGTVVGLCLPMLRHLLAEMGIPIASLWAVDAAGR
jgi:septum formation protein